MDEAGPDRPLGFPSLLALGVNGIVGVGIFFAPSSVAAEAPGMSGVLVYLVTALALLPIAAGYGALGSRFSVDGGPYVWADAAFGSRFAFFVGWVTFASSLFSIAAVLTGLSNHAAPLFGVTTPHGMQAFAVGCALVLAGVAATGLHPSAMVWSAVTVLKLIPLVAIVVLGTIAFGKVDVTASVSDLPVTAHAMERAVLVVVFASQGFEIVPLLAGSVRKSERSVPLATVASLVFAAMLYAALHAFTVRAVPDLAHSHTPLVDAASVYGGAVARDVVAAGANVSAFGILFGMLNTTPRYLSALSGSTAFGPWIGGVDRRFVPQRALWLTVGAVVVMVSLSSRITELFVLSSLAVLSQYSVVLASLAVLAWRGSHGLTRRHLWPVPLSLLGIALAAQGAEARELLVAAAVIVAGEGIRRWSKIRRVLV